MSTRLVRPSLWRQLLVTAALIAFQGYLGWSAVVGNFGFEGRKQMMADIKDLKSQSALLSAEIDSYRHRVALFDPKQLDPDILTEKARALLSMAEVGDMVVMAPQPPAGSSIQSTDSKSIGDIIVNSAQ